jgi:oligopeptide transport system substrate-binding protein
VENLVGCGPFILESRDDLGGLTVTRNTTYFRPFTGNLEKFQIILSPDRSNINRYRENEVDVRGYTPDQEEKLQANRDLVNEVRSANTHLTQYLTFNCLEPPFDNLLARRALAMAINKDWLVREIFQSPNIPAHGGLVPPAVAGHNPGIGYPFDPVTARRLLAEAGYPNGEGFPALHFKVFESRNFDRIDDLIQTWKDVLSINSTFEPGPFEEMMDIASMNPFRETRYPIFFMGWYMDYPDPHNMLTEATWVTGSGWKSQEFNKFIDQAVNTLDQQARIGLYKKADQLIIDQCVVVPLMYGVNEWLIKPWVKNYYPDADTIFSDPTAAIIEPHD